MPACSFHYFVKCDILTAHTGEPNDETLIDAKWESFTLAPVDDPAFPNDYFLFIAVS